LTPRALSDEFESDSDSDSEDGVEGASLDLGYEETISACFGTRVKEDINDMRYNLKFSNKL